VGFNPQIEIDYVAVPVEIGDTFLLCIDVSTSMSMRLHGRRPCAARVPISTARRAAIVDEPIGAGRPRQP
jgi:hypothetical protein